MDITDMKLISEKMPTSLSNNNGVLIIPEGYKYCGSCEAVTPHKPIDNSNIYDCKICQFRLYNFDNNCPNCGWEEPEDGMLYYDETVHHRGCHCERKEWKGENLIGQICNHYSSIADMVVDEFYKSWMKPALDRGSYSLPKDKEWYDKNQHLKKRWREMKDLKCGCPTYRVYCNTHVINYSSHYYPSMDCMNAMEWYYDVRCPICGFIFNINDSNC